MKRFEIEKWLERRKAAVSTPLSVLNGGAPGAASAEDIAHGKAWRLNFELFPAFLRILAAFFVLRLPHHWLLRANTHRPVSSHSSPHQENHQNQS